MKKASVMVLFLSIIFVSVRLLSGDTQSPITSPGGQGGVIEPEAVIEMTVCCFANIITEKDGQTIKIPCCFCLGREFHCCWRIIRDVDLQSHCFCNLPMRR